MLQKIKIIQIPIIDVKCAVILGDQKSVESYLQDVCYRRFESGPPNAIAETFYSDSEDVTEYIYIALYNSDLQNAAYDIIHECLHAAHKALEFRGISHDEELLCYLQGFLIEKVLECLNAELTVVLNPLPIAEDIP